MLKACCARELSAGNEAAAPSLRSAAAAGAALLEEGWTECPDGPTLFEGAPPPAPAPHEPAETGDWLRGWQKPAARMHNTSCRVTVRREWLRAIPPDAGSTLAPPEMLIALRRRLRLPLPWQLFGVAAAASPTAAPTSMRSAMRKLSALKAAWCLSSGCCTPLAPARPPGVAKRCAAT